MSRPVERRPLGKAAKAALDAFLRGSRGEADWQRALRALGLHMVRGHAPGFFAQHRLQRVLDAAVRALAQVPRALPAGLGGVEGMSRLDAAWVERAHGVAGAAFEAGALAAWIAEVQGREGLLWAWLLGELGEQLGLGTRVALEQRRPLEGSSPVEHVYWLTHEVLLQTRYLAQPPDAASVEAAQELSRSVGFLHAAGQLDPLGEVCVCQQAAGLEFAPALEILRDAQRRDGGVGDPDASDYDDAHLAAVAVLAFAGALERGAP